MASAEVKSEEHLYELWMLYKSKVLLSVGRRYLGQISEAYNVSIHNRHFKWLNSAKWCLNGQGSNADGYRPIAPKVQILAELHLKGGSSLRLLSSFSSLYNQIGCKRTTLPHFKSLRYTGAVPFSTLNNDVNLFKEYLSHFIAMYKEFIDVGFTSLNEGFINEGPHLTRLPEGLLQMVLQQLTHCSQWCQSAESQLLSGSQDEEMEAATQDTLVYIVDLLKCLIVVSRNTDNVAFVATCDYLTHIISMTTVILSLLSSAESEVAVDDEDTGHLMSFVRHALHFMECLYDPYFLWRKHLRGWQVNRKRLKSKPGMLHVEVVPFFYECFQQNCLSVDIQIHLFHVFGAILAGSQNNALKAICPATLDVLTKVLLGNQVVGPSNAVQDHLELKEIVLQCIMKVVHIVHTSAADMRQIEVGAVLEGYFQVFQDPDASPHSNRLHKQLLKGIVDMLNQSTDRPSLQVSFMAVGFFDTMLAFLHKITAGGTESQHLAIAVIQAINAVMLGSHTVKERFAEKVGYGRFVEALKSLGQPSRELLESILDLAVDGRFVLSPQTAGGNQYGSLPYGVVLHNPQAALLLIQWLPDIQSHHLQTWLSDCLRGLCMTSNHNRIQGCTHGMIHAIIGVLQRERQINKQAVGNLMSLLEWLGSQSITSTELTELIQLLKPDPDDKQFRYSSTVMHAMSKMARKDGCEGALHYFDLTHEESGLFLPTIHKWNGTGFTFHAWISLDHDSPAIISANSLVRRQLYSFSSSTGNGFEAFFTAESTLVIAVFMKKEYHAITLTDCPITDHYWHCIDIVHASSKRPFAQSQLSVYIDGKPKLSALLKFPPLTESFTNCVIGCPQLHTTTASGNHPATVAMETKSRLALPFKLPLAMRVTHQSPEVLTLTLGGQDEHFGAPVSLVGHVGMVCLLQDAIQANQVSALYSPGPNCMNVFQAESNQLSDLVNKTIFYYNPKACRGRMCCDLSSRQMICQLMGNNCNTSDIKNAINCIGGLLVLYPLMEQFAHCSHVDEKDLLLLDTPPDTPDECGWEVVPSSSYADVRLQQNRVAAFLTLLRNLVQSSSVNQETLLRENAFSILGALLQKSEPSIAAPRKFGLLLDAFDKEASLVRIIKVDPPLIDAYVLMAVQLLHESLAATDKTLLQHIYQYLLFDFSIWSKSEFCVRIGHIQYLNTLIKDDRKFFRKKYGVQFILDVIRKYYSMLYDENINHHHHHHYSMLYNLQEDALSSPVVSELAAEDCQTIRGSLYGLIKFYVLKDITFQELSQIIGFITAVKEEQLISDTLDLLLFLLEVRSKPDQIYLLLFEKNMADLLYGLLSNKDFSCALKEKVLVVLWLLLSTNKVYEKNKVSLRLIDNGLYPGLMCTMTGQPVSLNMAKLMFQQVLAVESANGVNAALYVIQMLHLADVDTKLEASRQLLQALCSCASAPKQFAQQIGWQDAIVRLFIHHPRVVSKSNINLNNCATESGSPERDTASGTSNIEDQEEYHPGMDFSDEDATQNGSCFHLTDDLISECSSAEGMSRSSTTSLEDLTVKKSGSVGALSIISASGDNGSTSTQNSEITQALVRMGLIRSDSMSMEKTEELCQNLLIILFTIMWKGVEGSGEQSWKERGQVLAALSYTGEENDLLQPRVILERRLLEMMLQGSILDLKEAGQTNPLYMENAMYLVKLLYNFLCLETVCPEEQFKEGVLDDLLTLLDLLTVWDVDNEWKEMEQLGLRILLAFAAQKDIDLCSIATARLHTLLQTRPVDKLQESCFVIGAIDAVITEAVDAGDEQYNFLIPIMKALVEKCHDMLDMANLLPSLPSTKLSPTFFDDFKTYCHSEEWRLFMKKQVLPSKEQYQANIFDDVRVMMKTFIGECHEMMMVASHKRSRYKGESKLTYQSQILDAFDTRSRSENKRYRCLLSQQKNQHAAALRQWRSLKNFYTSERGVWSDRCHEPVKYWKLSTQENYCRMRPKLVPNYSFDPHTDASRLRDNLVVEEYPEMSIKDLTLARQAKVADDNIGDDRLEDEEWDLISTASLVSGVHQYGEVSDVHQNSEVSGVHQNSVVSGVYQYSKVVMQISTASSKTEEIHVKEKLILSEQCELITIMESVKGRLEVTTTHVYFFDGRLEREEGLDSHWDTCIVHLIELMELNVLPKDFKWALSQLREIHFRRYNLRRSALEFFLVDQTNYFVNFEKKVRNKVYSRILSLRPPNLIYYGSRSPVELLRSSGLTQFPWILKDYTSEKLDFTNPDVYRDLSRPIGVVNPKNEKDVREKYESFEDPSGTIEKFHYGTHYSNAAGVMHYLLRMEPFTTLHIQLQSGRFDVTDRQFHSIPATWQTLYDTPNDVKELIPEFFYLPEFLKNLNNFDLGKLQVSKEVISDVILPKWASSPEDFIHKHMQALESEHVSAHLHEWIDLIFGYKQKGQAAVEALNVFYYCTYEGAVDLDAITSPVERKALEGMINNFGQTPCQLLKEPHPKRWSQEEAMNRAVKFDKQVGIFLQVNCLKAFFVEAALVDDPLAFVCVPRNQARSFIQHGMPDVMVIVTSTGILGTHGWLPYDKNISSYFTFEKDPTMSNLKTRRCLSGPFAPDIQVSSHLFAVSHDAKLVFSGGHWDNSLRVYSLAKAKTIMHVIRHIDIVTCIALDTCGSHLISGSRDTTCILWKIDMQTSSSPGIQMKPLHILYGHTAEVSTVAISVELDMVVTGAKDGLVNVHTVRKGMYLRTLLPPVGEIPTSMIHQITLSEVGHICVYCSHRKMQQKDEKLSLQLYSINGNHLASETVYVPIQDMLTADGHLIFGNLQGVLVIKQLFGFSPLPRSLKTISTMQLKEAITCLTITNNNSHLMIGLQDGSEWSALNMAQAICPNVDWTVGPHGRDGYQQFPNQSQQGTADHSQKADLGTTPKVLFANLEPDDMNELHIDLLAQKKALRKLCSAHMMGNMIQGGQTLQSPPTTPTNHQQNVSSNLATILGFGTGGSTTDQSTRHNAGSGERVYLDPLNYMLPKQKVKHLDITDYINATGQEVVVKAGPKKIQLGKCEVHAMVAAHIRIMMELLTQGRLQRGAIFDYIAYTVKISEMAEGHLWPSVMAFDRSYRQLQAQHGFRWGRTPSFDSCEPETSDGVNTNQQSAQHSDHYYASRLWLAVEKTADDYLVISDNYLDCMTGLNTLITLLRLLGFGIAWEKTAGPTRSLTFLGIKIDNESFTLNLPEDKVTSLSNLLRGCKRSCRQLQQLAERLSWAAHVVNGGRVYLQRWISSVHARKPITKSISLMPSERISHSG
ncbi:hypothetical protein LSH36_5g09019 [Paralvinella palmiformis]|uniref:Neurobeachin-like protein 1 n=1 Tax=Paralvinella palmiformis TaxID=53620 RepID=A0AAD9NIY0_9ANNE|nr:hypothetical protein LSH36_5g09019 [Paralvinella palmiformis]